MYGILIRNRGQHEFTYFGDVTFLSRKEAEKQAREWEKDAEESSDYIIVEIVAISTYSSKLGVDWDRKED